MERRYDRCGSRLRDPGGCRAQRRSVDPDRRGDGTNPRPAERSHRHAGWWPARGHDRRLRPDRGVRRAAGPRRGSRWNGPRRRCAGARPPQDYLAALTRRRRTAASASSGRASQADCALELEHPPQNPAPATRVPIWVPASGDSLPASGAETVPPSEDGGSLPASGAETVPPSEDGGSLPASGAETVPPSEDGGSLPASGAETVPPSEDGGSLPASGAEPVPPSEDGGSLPASGAEPVPPSEDGGSLPASGAEPVPPSEEGGSPPASGAGPVPPSKGGGGGGGGGRSLPSACRMSPANSARAVAISSAVAVSWYVVGNTLRARAMGWLPNPSVLARFSNS